MMSPLLRLLVSALLAFTTTTAATASGKQGTTLECDGYRNNTELSECRSREMDVSEFKLNQAYKALLAELDTLESKDFKKSLIESQRAWIAWRAKEANWCSTAAGWPVAPGYAGSGTGTQVGFCWEAINDRRTAELRNYLKEVRESLNGL